MSGRIVEQPLKIDLHIHSYHSHFKENGGLTLNCTKEHLGVLVKHLVENEVDMVSITDHDVFSYELYQELKNKEKDGTFKKVLPGVEFSLFLKKEDGTDWPVHVIAIFNDDNDEKIKGIEKCLGDGVTKMPQYDYNGRYTQSKLIELLDEIGLDTVFIVHQKQTISSKSKPQKNDAFGVGKREFNKFIYSEFFQALEFHDKKNELFNAKANNEFNDDLLRFITGSDCHDWEVYPNHDSLIADSDNFRFTYLKCLPTFRGLAMALTDNNRISLNPSFFSVSNKFLRSIELVVDGRPVSIPLSKGINAIIGDNSIGKSLLLHKITNYYRETEAPDTSVFSSAKNLKSKYESYLSKKNVSVLSSLDRSFIFDFDTQGEIRKKFSEGRLSSIKFVAERSPNNPAINEAKQKVLNYVNSYLDYLKGISNIEILKSNLNNASLKIYADKLEATTLKVNQTNLVDYSNKKSAITTIKTKISSAKDSLTNVLEYANDEEKEAITAIVKTLDNMLERYSTIEMSHQNVLDILTIINNELSLYSTRHQSEATDDDKLISDCFNKQETFINDIVNYLKVKNNDLPFSNPTIQPFVIQSEKLVYGEYKIVNCSSVKEINNEYLLELFKSPLNAKTFVKDTFLNTANLKSALSRYNGPENEAWDFYERKIKDKVNEDIKSSPRINMIDDEDGEDKSQGFDQKMYFKVICSDNKKEGIYIIDQPEDDISQKSIRDELIKHLRKMSKYRQVILVTHNPQFVVNLDVDNVICLSENATKNIVVHSGALEYMDSEQDILKDVAEILDGGVLTIRRRWKRYEKNIDDIIG